MRNLILFLLCFSIAVYGDTPPPNTVKAKMYSGDGLTAVQVSSDGSMKVQATIDTTGLATDTGQTAQTVLLTTISSKLTSPITVTGPLTNTQLRASPIDVSGTFSIDTSLLATAANQVTGNNYLSGLLTDAQLRASPLSVSTGLLQGLTDTQLRASPVVVSAPNGVSITNSVAVTGPVTDSQLRATPVPISGSVSTGLSQPLTDAQLRATSVNVSNTTFATSALQTTGNASLSSIDSKLTAPLSVSLTNFIGLTNTQLRTTPVDVSGAFAVTNTVNVSNTAFATAARQDTGNTSLSNIQSFTDIISQAIGIQGQAPIGSSYLISGVNPSGNSTYIKTNSSGELITVVSGTGATSVTVTSGTIQVGPGSSVIGSISNTAFTANAGTNLNTSALNLETTQAAMSAKLPSSLGIKTAANSISTAPASDAIFRCEASGTTVVSGPLTDTQLRATAVPISISSGSIANTSFIATQSTATNLKTQAESYQGGSAVSISNPLFVTASSETTKVIGQVTANAGTNLNTSLLALESGGNLATIKTNTDNLGLSLGSATSGQKGNLILGAITTSDPSYTTAQTNALSLLPNGYLRVSSVASGTTAISAASLPLPSGAAQEHTAAATPSSVRLSDGSAFYKGTTPSDTQPISAASLPLPTLAATSTKQSDGTQKTQIVDGSGNVIAATSNALNINISSGSIANTTFAATQGTATNLKTQAENYQGGTAVGSANPLYISIAGVSTATALPVSFSAASFSLAGVSTTNYLNVSGTPLSILADSVLAQGSTTSGQKGGLVMAAVTTQAPAYTTAQTSPLSIDVLGNLRVIATPSGTTTISNTSFTATQATGTNLHTVVDSGSITATQATGSNLHAVIDTGSTTAVTQATGTNLHTVVDSGAVTVTNATATNLKVQAEAYQGGVAVGSAAPLAISIASVSSSTPLNVSATTSGINPAGTATSIPVTGIDSGNSTTATLGANAIFTGTYKDISSYSNVTVNISSDQSSAANGFQMQYSTDGTNLDSFDQYTIPAGTGQEYSASLGTKFFRVVYTNGGTIQGAFRMATKIHTGAIKPSSVRLADSQSDQADVTIDKAVIAAISGTSTVNVFAPNNALAVSETNMVPDFVSTATVSSTDAINTSFALRLANAQRINFEVMNMTDANCWLRFSTSAATSSTATVMLLASGGYYKQTKPVYTGQVNAICSANGTTGKLNFTELP